MGALFEEHKILIYLEKKEGLRLGLQTGNSQNQDLVEIYMDWKKLFFTKRSQFQLSKEQSTLEIPAESYGRKVEIFPYYQISEKREATITGFPKTGDQAWKIEMEDVEEGQETSTNQWQLEAEIYSSK
ncbi:MAG: hypothetical protein O6848_02320 [Bacteroidetes bacterium]|nr:hypothetical protein [Bacteroidota bacterium]